MAKIPKQKRKGEERLAPEWDAYWRHIMALDLVIIKARYPRIYGRMMGTGIAIAMGKAKADS